MSTPSSKTGPKKWIDLGDPGGAKLKIGPLNGAHILVIEGVRPRGLNFHRTIEKLGFTPSKNGKYLVKRLPSLDINLTASSFHSVFPRAFIRPMEVDEFRLNLEGLVKKQAEKVARERAQANGAAEDGRAGEQTLIESIQEVLNRSTYLGRNSKGLRVFNDAQGRFIVDTDDKIVREGELGDKPTFLRAATQSQAQECAKGLLRAIEAGESQHTETLMRFASAVLQKEVDALTPADRRMIAQAIDTAVMASLVEFNATAGKSWADAAYFQEMMPGRAAFCADAPETPYLPVPIAVQAQRFLTSANAVIVNGSVPNFAFGLLPENAQVYIADALTLEACDQTNSRPFIESALTQDVPADGGYWRLSGQTSEDQILEFFGSQSDDAVSVVTAGDLEDIEPLRSHAKIIQAVKVPNWLSNTLKPIYMAVIKKGEPDAEGPVTPAQINSWDDLKTLADETLLRLGREDEAREVIATESKRTENRFQRPYLAFSKVGQASTMVPKNMQAALGFALSRIESVHGDIDTFVGDELGIGDETLGSMFSAEQVDAIGLAINRIQSGRGFILGDETGIGKGRTIAALATWAEKQGKKVIFITDRSNLFSDLARDLIDIGEWERFRPMITNADGTILNIMGDAEELAQPLSATEMKKAMELKAEEIPANIIFTTYSQISTEDSEKAAWLQSICKDALVIADESHIAAGSDSNIAKQVQTLVDTSWGALYSSATWAKSSKNLHIYSRALPESVNINQVVSAMKSDGESFGEVFSSMLAADGAFIRREHDLSKIDFVVDEDTEYAERNQQVAAVVSEILGMMAMVSGEINHMLQRMNNDTRNALLDAASARKRIQVGAFAHDAQVHAEHTRLDLAEQTAYAEFVGGVAQPLTVWLTENSDVRIQQAQAETLVGNAGLIESLTREKAVREGRTQEEADQLVAAALVRNDEISAARLRLESFLLSHEAELQGDSHKGMGAKLFASSFGTGGAIYTVMRRTLAALSVDHTADKAVRAAQAGRRPVIVFEETGEAFVRQFIQDEIERIKVEISNLRSRSADEMTDADRETQKIADLLESGAKAADVVSLIRMPNLQDMLRHLLTRLGGIKVMETSVEVENKPKRRAAARRADHDEPAGEQSSLGEELTDAPVPAETENPGFSYRFKTEVVATQRVADLPGFPAETLEAYMKGIEAIAKKIEEIPPLPIIPVDALRTKFEKAGLTMGEISGRHYELHPIFPDSSDMTWGPEVQCRLVKRNRKKSDVTQTVKAFNSAKIDALAINKSAATGLSVHSSPRFEDSRQRELFEMQSDENPTNRIQLFGRVNRFDQVVPPKISMMTTGLRGELRSVMMQNKKLTNLSANIRSSRENAALIDDVPDLLNKTGDRVCQEYLLENPGIAGRLDIPMARISQSYGLANMMTQRLALLSPAHQDKIYEDISIAYADAVLENELALDGDNIPTRNWRAKTVSQKVAWGPTEHIDAISAFDGPVFQREVEFTQDYQPYHWDEIHGAIAESSQRLESDPRVRPMHIVGICDDLRGRTLLSQQLTRETAASAADQQNQFVRGLVESMTLSLPEDALGVGNSDVDDEFAEENPQLQGVMGRRRALGFSALARHWVAAESRVPGTRLSKRFMALVSPSGSSAKLWFLNDKSEAEVYLLDLDKAIADQDGEVGGALRFLGKEELDDKSFNRSWQRGRFDRTWGSVSPDVRLLSFDSMVDSACQVMESKKIIALQGTDFKTVDAALAHSEHNAVKEANFRQMFMKQILKDLIPGTRLWVSTEAENARFSIFSGRSMVVTNVQLPPPGQESVLSRWKFSLANPGDEEVMTLSGAMLFRLAGKAPMFNHLTVRDNLYSGMGYDISHVARTFDSYQKGPIKRRRTILMGNLFQAGEWARDSKRGTPIIYTDEAGQGHRAIEIAGSELWSHGMRFPLRVYERESIVNFFNRMFDLENGPSSAVLYTSFRGVLAAQSGHNVRPDQLILDLNAGAIGWLIDKEEKDRVRRVLRAATKADKAIWDREHPDEPYPVNFSTTAPRRSDASQIMLSIKLPETKEGRARFLDLFIRTLGMQLFIQDDQFSPAARLAREVEREYYARLAQPVLEERERHQAIRDRRAKNREMLNTAFGATSDQGSHPATAPVSATEEPQALDEDAQENSPHSASEVQMQEVGLHAEANAISCAPQQR